MRRSDATKGETCAKDDKWGFIFLRTTFERLFFTAKNILKVTMIDQMGHAIGILQNLIHMGVSRAKQPEGSHNGFVPPHVPLLFTLTSHYETVGKRAGEQNDYKQTKSELFYFYF